MTELKRCPFCGSEMEIKKFWTAGGTDNKLYDHAPQCKNECCIARNEEGEDLAYPAATYLTPEEAAAAWNTRPIEDELQARIAQLTAERNKLAETVGLMTTLKPTMVVDSAHPVEMALEVSEYITQLTAERDELKDVLTDIKTGQSVEKETCSWIQEDDPDDICYWETGCGNSFYFTEGTPTDNDMKYCCYCGKLLKQED